jgi:phosphoribosylaminoimidazolecarboxamide formyltransferase/IMP cyclohydrolase
MNKKITTALISVYHKEGLDEIAKELTKNGITIYSTGGTQKYLEERGCKVNRVEDLTGYPSILGGRVKTLHPKVFGGILAQRNAGHLGELDTYTIPALDLVVVDLYPFEETLKHTDAEADIIEKIDIGGISLIRAAAKNYRDVAVVASKADYGTLLDILQANNETSLEDRAALARNAFNISSLYDTAIHRYFEESIAASPSGTSLRYGENPHQVASFRGELSDMFDKLGGKDLSYNNLVDVDAAVELMQEYENEDQTFAILKHTNVCGLASRSTMLEAWHAALAGDPVSAFGGILVCNGIIDKATAEQINTIFYEVLIAQAYTPEALEVLQKKKKRILLKKKGEATQRKISKTLLNGEIIQDRDLQSTKWSEVKIVTKRIPTSNEADDLLYAEKCAKHLKSNTIVLVKDRQLLGMGCGQTSRVDACNQAIDKAKRMGMDLTGAVMASDAFFPFPDCVELAHKAGITAVIQPGGSIKDQLSIDYCDDHGVAMVFTGVRHFKH